MGGFGSVGGKALVCEEADLFEDGGLVPVDVFVGKFTVTEAYDGYERDFDVAVGGFDVGEEPGHLDGVGEGDDHLVDEGVFADGARDVGHLEVGRHARNKVIAVEGAEGGFSFAAGRDWNVIDVSVFDHCGERRFRIVRVKFKGNMLFP